VGAVVLVSVSRFNGLINICSSCCDTFLEIILDRLCFRRSIVQQKRKPGNRVDVRGPLANSVGRVRHIRHDHADCRVENNGQAVHELQPERRRSLFATTVDLLRDGLGCSADRVLRATATDGPVQHPRSEHRRQRWHSAHRQPTRRSEQSDVPPVTGPVASVFRYAAASANLSKTAVRHHPTDTAKSRSRCCSTTTSSRGKIDGPYNINGIIFILCSRGMC